MRILYTMTTIKGNGGVQRIIFDKCNYLVTHGYEIAIAYFGTNSDKPSFYVDDRIKLYPINIDAKNGSAINKIKSLIKSISIFKDIVTKERPEVIDNANAIILSWLIPFLNKGAKTISELHQSYDGVLIFNNANYGENSIRSKVLMSLRKHIYPKYDKVVVLTDEDRMKWRLDNCITIPNFTNIHGDKELDYSQKTAIWVGRLTHQKGVDIFINVLKKLLVKVPDWKYIVIGDGCDSYSKEMKDFVKLHEDEIHYVRSTDKIQEYYEQASLYISTSRFEGLPLSLIEAATMGLPIAGFKITGNDQVVEDGVNGKLATPFEEEELIGDIVDLMGHPDKRESMGARAKNITRKYNKENVMVQWIRLFTAEVSR